MSSTKVYGDSTVTAFDGDEGERPSAADEGRRRYLMRYVVAVIGVSAMICVAAGVRVAVARPGSADANLAPAVSLVHESPSILKSPTNSVSESPSPTADPPTIASAAAPSVHAAPSAAASAAPAAVHTAPAHPIAPAPRVAGAAEGSPPSGSGRPQRTAPRPKSRTSSIEHNAPF
jgi:hypothetical protein